MKKIKIFLTAFAVVATVGSVWAVNVNFFGGGCVYCANTCSSASRVDFRINPAGTSTKPCGVGPVGNEKASWTFDRAGTCTQNNLGLKYDATCAGK